MMRFLNLKYDMLKYNIYCPNMMKNHNYLLLESFFDLHYQPDMKDY